MDAFLRDLEGDGERYSFDSDGFDEDSICSWISEPESLCNVWRGWTWKNSTKNNSQTAGQGSISSLIELAAKSVASHIPFAVVESYPEPIPEDLQLKIAFWSFPESEEDIRLYSCLANGSADEFVKGEQLFKSGSVKDALQIGFHLSGVVSPPQTSQAPLKEGYRTSVVFDRQRITANNCTCDQPAWCQHIVALCLHRINQATQVKLRAPISESLGRLDRSQLQKFAQYLIHELQDQQILPTAQRLLDELLSTLPSKINKLDGAPDPTAGPECDAYAAWHMDQRILHENIKKTLVKFCVPAPVVYSDLNCLSSSAPPAAAEWQSLLRPLRGREPEGIWNLLSIVRELFRRQDSNAVPLLEILTDEMLQCEQLLVWWFATKLSSAHNSITITKSAAGNNSNSAQNAASSLCDEIVTLWRLVALNPCLSPLQRDDLRSQLETWHIMTLDKVRTAKCSNSSKKDDIELFPGFKPAFEVTQIDWSDYRIAGVTYNESKAVYQSNASVPGQTCLTSDHCKSSSKISPVINYKVDDSKYSFAADEQDFRHPPATLGGQQIERIDESSGSEGFCDQEPASGRTGEELEERDSDSSDEGIKLNKDGYMAADDDSDLELSVATGGQAKPAISNASQSGEVGASAQAAKQHHVGGAEALDVYMYDTTLTIDLSTREDKTDEPNYFAGVKTWEDKNEILFARAEALHAHGYTQQACELASKLATDMLKERENALETAKRTRSVDRHSSLTVASVNFNTTPSAKAAFLCTVLLENPSYHHLAFRIGMYGLEMEREPAPSKALEVKLANQENELVSLLKKIPLREAELNVVRERAEQLRDGVLRSRGEAHLPLMLTTFIFESLCLQANSVNAPTGGDNQLPCRDLQQHLLPTDEQLGFDAAVTALGLKANVSEAQHPLICEGIRRQKGDLAIAMMMQYKNDQYKLDKILEKLLDKEIHQLFKAPPISSYLMPNSAGNKANGGSGSSSQDVSTASASLNSMSLDDQRTNSGSSVVRPKASRANRSNLADSGSTSGLDDAACRDMEAKLRCGLYGKLKRPSVGMAAVDSSAPETTSSDNSPTVGRRHFVKNFNGGGGGGSDSESSGRSSDSVGSASSHPRPQRPRNAESPSIRYQYTLEPRSMKVPFRSKGKTRITPTEPNQPSEALAHFLFELAKTLLQKAGGSSSTSLFTQRDNTTHSVPHRLLHICAFQVGLYALGIHNCVTKNWLSRTYSSHVSWITGQAIEIGSVAINILIDTWEGHLTPTEVASLTDRASRGRDPNMLAAAAELALSCLAHAQALNPQETRRALLQCKEQSNVMLEKGCRAVEGAAKDSSVSPEVLFDVARKWFELYEESRQNQTDQSAPVDSQQMSASPQPYPQQQQQHQYHMQQSSHVVPITTQHPNNVTNPMEVPPHTAQSVVSVAAVCRGFQPVMTPVTQASAYPIHYNTYLPCYPATQYPNPSGQGQHMQPTTTNYMAAAVPFGYNQTFPVAQMGGIVPHGVANIYMAANPMYTNGGGAAAVVTIANGMPNQMMPMNPQGNLHNPQQHPPQVHQQQFALAQNSEQFNFVMSAFRVGMLALETYGRRMSDERPQTKYNRNPACREDIKWLLNLSIKLGPNYLQQFCQIAGSSLFSPFILYDIAMEVACFQSRNSQVQQQSIFRTPMLSALMQKCMQMFIQCSHHRIHHIQAADYDEFVSIIVAAKKAFCMVPSGMMQFQELLQGLKRNKSCKKELWQRIMTGLSSSVS